MGKMWWYSDAKERECEEGAIIVYIHFVRDVRDVLTTEGAFNLRA
jgi:hypothetical protein